MDIMRHGANVEVVMPEELRAKIQEELRCAAGRYSKTSLD